MSSNISRRLQDSLGNRYRVERELGRGGMATVYLAHDLRHDRPVALKVIHPELGAALGERFLREIRVAARLGHPHILTVHDSGEADGLLWYSMPVVDGESLRARLRREGPLPLDEAVRMGRSVAEALDFAHSKGVVHRDIKPENILLFGNEPMVADFGIALAVDATDQERLTLTGLSLGTPAYMSPEQWVPKDQDIVAYCHGPYCVLSLEAVQLLTSKGYRATRLDDGFVEWAAAGLPVERGTPEPQHG